MKITKEQKMEMAREHVDNPLYINFMRNTELAGSMTPLTLFSLKKNNQTKSV